MSSYFVIGNPIDHSLSPLIHNYWLKKYGINSTYEKKKLEINDLEGFAEEMRNSETINGANVTVPYKNEIIPFLDGLTAISDETSSVNTILKENGKLIGHNTDATAFHETLNKYSLLADSVLIIGAGGVTPSIIWGIRKLNLKGKLYITNRTKEKAIQLVKKLTPALNPNSIEILDWGDVPNAKLIVNTTSIGLSKNDNLPLDFENYQNNKNCMFYDLIYNPKETKFLINALKRGNNIMNGKMMFLLQAKQAFNLWTKVEAKIDDEILKIVD